VQADAALAGLTPCWPLRGGGSRGCRPWNHGDVALAGPTTDRRGEGGGGTGGCDHDERSFGGQRGEMMVGCG
jgi:hypothetical protein